MFPFVSLCIPEMKLLQQKSGMNFFFFTPLTNHKVIITTVPSEDFVYNTKHQHISMKELTREQHSVELVTINSVNTQCPELKI